MRLINPIYFCSQSVTNRKVLCFLEDYYWDIYITRGDDLHKSIHKSSIHLVKSHTVDLFQISFSSFKQSLKIFAAALLIYVLLFFLIQNDSFLSSTYVWAIFDYSDSDTKMQRQFIWQLVLFKYNCKEQLIHSKNFNNTVFISIKYHDISR